MFSCGYVIGMSGSTHAYTYVLIYAGTIARVYTCGCWLVLRQLYAPKHISEGSLIDELVGKPVVYFLG